MSLESPPIRPDQPGELHVDVIRTYQHVDIRLAGELDLETGAPVADAIAGPLAATVVVDLSDLTFIDSTGLHLLVSLHDRAELEGFTLRVVGASGPVLRTLQISGVDGRLNLDED